MLEHFSKHLDSKKKIVAEDVLGLISDELVSNEED